MRAGAAEGGGAAPVAGDTRDRGDPQELRERRTQQKCTRAPGDREIGTARG